MNSSSKLNRAFTLIEMLTVIAIVALLAALLFPAINGGLAKSKVNKAQLAVTSDLATALRSYYNEYGKWPVADTVAGHTYIIDANFVALLQGANPATPPNPLGPGEPAFGPPFNPVNTATLQGNPRQIHFLDFKAADLVTTPTCISCFLDPWKQPYYCRFDVTYQNQVDYPFSAPGTPVKEGFIVWSAGPNGQYDRNDTIVTASPLVVNSSGANKDNVKNW
jgi:prepilin-type N-terminal cleavage/methylation domain-containing protein